LTGDPLVAAPGEFHVDIPQVVGAFRTTHTITGLSGTGTLRGSAFAQNQENQFSVSSNVATKAFTASVGVTQSVDITVRPPIPNSPTGFVIE
jgi:hypothetical protein